MTFKIIVTHESESSVWFTTTDIEAALRGAYEYAEAHENEPSFTSVSIQTNDECIWLWLRPRIKLTSIFDGSSHIVLSIIPNHWGDVDGVCIDSPDSGYQRADYFI